MALGERRPLPSGTLVPGTKVGWRAKRFKEVGTVEYHNPGTNEARVRWPHTPADAHPDDLRVSTGSLGEHEKHPLKMHGKMGDGRWGN